jgi:glutamine synthetase
VDDLADLVEREGIRLLSLLHVGGDGELKALDFAPVSRAHAAEVLSTGERADGSSLFPGIAPGRSDVVLVPRPATAFLDPFAPHPALAVLCAHADRNGAPLAQSPATIVRAARERLRRVADLELRALGEVEYFLGRRAAADEPARDGDRGYHAAAPTVFGEELRRRALVTLAGMGVPVKYAHAEVGRIAADEAAGVVWEQHEIELQLAALDDAADGVVLARWVLRNLAHRDGSRISFDPIVQQGHAGTGLHFHFSARVGGEAQPVRDPSGALTETARWLLAGLVQAGGALMAFGNRVEGSFVRLSQAKEAPNAVVWGERDRTALVRIPLVPAPREGRAGVLVPTIEFRLPDGSAHPHLLLAGVAQAVLLGRATPAVDALLERTASAASGGPAEGEPVPRAFAEVARALERRRGALEEDGVFPPAMLDAILARLRG